MLRIIIEKEVRDILGSTKFAITFAVCAVLILLAFYVGARGYEVSKNEYYAALEENRDQMAGLTDWDDVDHRVFLEPQPLSVLVSGVSNDIGRTVEVRTRGELSSEDSRYNADPVYAVFRFLDLDFIFQIVLSLFAILFAYDAVNGEKERGTLRLSFANSVPRATYIVGKLVGSFLSLIIPLMIPIALGCMLLFLFDTGGDMSGEDWTRLLLVLASGFLFFGVFLALSVFISAMTERSSSSFLMLLVVWIFAVLIIPRISVLISGNAVEVPSVNSVQMQKSQYMSQLWTEDSPKMMKWWSDNSAAVANDRQAAMRDFRAYMQELNVTREEKMNIFAERLNEERTNGLNQQQKLALGIARVSPASVFSLAATNLSGTSLKLNTKYLEDVGRYQETYRAFMQEKTGRDGDMRFFGGGGGGGRNETEEEIDPRELPEFQFEPIQLGESINASLMDFGLLLFFNIVFFVGAFIAFLRYDVR